MAVGTTVGPRPTLPPWLIPDRQRVVPFAGLYGNTSEMNRNKNLVNRRSGDAMTLLFSINIKTGYIIE